MIDVLMARAISFSSELIIFPIMDSPHIVYDISYFSPFKTHVRLQSHQVLLILLPDKIFVKLTARFHIR